MDEDEEKKDIYRLQCWYGIDADPGGHDVAGSGERV